MVSQDDKVNQENQERKEFVDPKEKLVNVEKKELKVNLVFTDPLAPKEKRENKEKKDLRDLPGHKVFVDLPDLMESVDVKELKV